MASRSPGIIDPRLQYAQHPAPPPYAQQSSEALRRASQRHSQSPSQLHHQPSQGPATPQQPYFISAPSRTPVAVPPQDSYDPALEGDGSPTDSGSSHPSPLGAATGDTLGSAGNEADPKRSRACDSCRGLKVKCDFGDGLPGEPCKRCVKARRPCIVTPATRKRQKKADSRVAELERKVDALTARLAEKDDGRLLEALSRDLNAARKRSLSPGASTAVKYSAQAAQDKGSPEKRRRLDHQEPSQETLRQDQSEIFARDSPANPGFTSLYNRHRTMVFDHSAIERAISKAVDDSTAERLFNRYLTKFMPQFPAVPFPPATNAIKIRKTKPILFLAILSSTCYGANIPVETQLALEEAWRDALADCLWKKGEKSVEIIQALHIATIWYRPPANFEQHILYQMVHVSACMAIDLGIGKRMLPERRRLLAERWRREGFVDPESAEVRRAWLTSYFFGVSISMLLRRPILFRFTEYTQECLEYLETADDALDSDKVLCQHIRFAHICEEVSVQFAFDDPAVNLSISDGKVTYGIKHFEKDLAEVAAKPISDRGVKLTEHVTNLYLHEIALHSQNNIEDNKAPFMEETFRVAAGQSVLGPQHVDALTACHSACRRVLDTYISSDIEVIYTMPIVFSVRCMYTIVVLVKLYIAASAPGEIGNVIKPDDLHVDEYIERLRQIFQSFLERDAGSPHSKFFFLMQRLKERFQDIKRGDANVVEAARAVKFAAATASAAVKAPAGGETKHDQTRPVQQPALGLQALSEAAMIGNQQHQLGCTTGGTIPSQLAQVQPTTQGWYPEVEHLTNMSVDPQSYQYLQQVPVTGVENFDYDLGGLGMGMDGAISGLFMADGLWNYNEPQAGVYRGWT